VPLLHRFGHPMDGAHFLIRKKTFKRLNLNFNGSNGKGYLDPGWQWTVKDKPMMTPLMMTFTI
jgi:hypothetical protein